MNLWLSSKVTMSIKTPSLLPETTNEYWRTNERQLQFWQTLEQKKLPPITDLYNRSEKSNPANNWFNAWIRFSEQNMYREFKEEEFSLLKNLPDDILTSFKKAKYIVDYWCWDSKTTIRVLQWHIDQWNITAEDLRNKEFIVYDGNGAASWEARNNMIDFLTSLNLSSHPRVNSTVENRNEVTPPHTILHQYPWDKFIFSTWCTIGNLSDSDKNHFCNFDPKYKHTLLTTYFTEPKSEDVPFIEATYWNKAVHEQLLLENISQEDLDAMSTAATNQLTNMLRAWWRTDDELTHIEITSKYDQETWWIVAWFQLHENVQKNINGTQVVLNPWFYPLYPSKRFSSESDPLWAKKHFSERRAFVGCDVYELDYTWAQKTRNIILGVTTLVMLVLATIFSQPEIPKDTSAKKNKEKAILSLVDQSLRTYKKEWYIQQPDNFKIDLFYQRTNSIGHLLDIFSSSNEFTWWGKFVDELENFLIQELDKFDEIAFFSVDRHVEALQATEVDLAIKFFNTHPLITAQYKERLRTISLVKEHTNALNNSLALSPAEQKNMQQQSSWNEVTILGESPIVWYQTRNTYTFGITTCNNNDYIVCVPSPLLETKKVIDNWIMWTIKQPIQTYFVGNEIWSFSLNSSVVWGLKNTFTQLNEL